MNRKRFLLTASAATTAVSFVRKPVFAADRVRSVTRMERQWLFGESACAGTRRGFSVAQAGYSKAWLLSKAR